jgi:hypothetical protein
MRGRLIASAVVAAALAVPATAGAGGWATVELSSTPEQTAPGKAWVVDLEVLQHGRTPLEGVQPSIVVTERETGATRTVAAKATGKPGVYRARVVFPTAGVYEYVVDDGFSQRHSYPPVRISSGAAAVPLAPDEDGQGFRWLAFVAAVIAGTFAAGATSAVQRRRAAHAAEAGS